MPVAAQLRHRPADYSRDDHVIALDRVIEDMFPADAGSAPTIMAVSHL
jgi:hypothetical protein